MILVDPPRWPAHGRRWSHLVSDQSFAELHAFARQVGVPVRGFHRDHYDVPADAYDRVVAHGAQPADSRAIVAALTAAGLRRPATGALRPRPAGSALVRPDRLVPGDVVAVVAPAGPVSRDRLEAGVALLESWGLRIRLGRHVLSTHRRLGHLADTDARRTADLAEAWTAPDVAAVWVARGGFGCHRLIDRLDWRALSRAGPRLLIGFSDATALHEALAQRLGVVSLHAPVIGSLADSTPTALEQLRCLLLQPERALELTTGVPLTRITGGIADGVLVGGNLRVLTASLGTAVSQPARDGIAVLEDTGEAAYKIDGMLTQLRRAGWFDGVRAVVCGAFTETDGTDVDAVLVDRLGDLGVPAVRGAPFGHLPDNRPLPLGVRARLDADAGAMWLATPALA